MPALSARSVTQFALACALAFSGCSGFPPIGGEPDLSEEASELVRDYLTQVSTDTPDRGWCLLLPITRASTFGDDLVGYVDAATRTDWSAFTWRIGYIERDDPYAYEVSIQLASGSRLPALVAAVTYFEDAPGGRGPTFSVRFLSPVESGGIHHFGDRGLGASGSPSHCLAAT
jgi:hypothetical protein